MLGVQVKSPKAFNQRIYTLIKDAMDLKGDLTVTASEDAIEVGLLIDTLPSVPFGLACLDCSTLQSQYHSARVLPE